MCAFERRVNDANDTDINEKEYTKEKGFLMGWFLLLCRNGAAVGTLKNLRVIGLSLFLCFTRPTTFTASIT